MPLADEITLEHLDGAHHVVLAELRSHAPIAWVPAIGGWLITGRDLAVRAMRDARTFTVDDPRFSTAQVIGPSMLSLDGAAHRRLRRPFADAYRTAEVAVRDGDVVKTIAGRLVEDLEPRGEAELRRELAGPLAVAVVAMSLGLADLDPERLRSWYDEIAAAVTAVSAGEPLGTAAHEAFGLLGVAIEEAARTPGSVLQCVARMMSRDEVIANAAVCLFGGIETSEAMTTNVLYHLLSHPSQMTLVRDERTLVDAAVEESLRLEPAAARVDRYATGEVVFGGESIGQGDLVVVSLAAANRDPITYDHPDQFIVERPNARSHLAFAVGPHGCIGASLARMQTRATVNTVLDRLHDISLAGPADVRGLVFRKPVTLAVVWSPDVSPPYLA